MKGINTEKIDSKIPPRLLVALENYMAINQRNKSDAIRILLTNALRTEKLLEEITR